MRMVDIIIKKRKGEELSTHEINYFVNGFTLGEIPDYQASALLMSIFFNKMNPRETVDLTMAMVNSGEKLSLNEIEGIKVDKHSTGGVGDKTTILLAPMVASCGVPVAKMSGRGLGHTGGTIDKLEAFEGFSVDLPREKFIENVNRIGLALVAQSGHLAPADKKIYALRDVTGTVENISLIASSIMSKKIASGANGIVLDVKVGDGAFMKTPEAAIELAKEMVSIGKGANRQTIAVISDMDQPLGYAIGNSLELVEAIETLKGRGPKDLYELSLVLGSNMLMLANKVKSEHEGRIMLQENIKNGKALQKLKEFVEAQGGRSDLIDNTDLFEIAKYKFEVKSNKSGVISKIKAEQLGVIAMRLGAGRATKDSKIDLSVGIVLKKKRGEFIKAGEILGYIHANDELKGLKAVNELINNIEISDSYESNIPLIYKIIK